MNTIKVIRAKCWKHANGRQASIYGAAPWTSDAEKANWKLVENGWTWECTDFNGRVTVGMCRVPAKTREAADAEAARCAAMTGATVIH